MTSRPRGAFALIGDPVAHSVSPPMHRAAFASLGLDLGYEAVTVRRDDLADAFPRLRQSYLGLNVTTPLKEAVAPLLDAVSSEAAGAGSVNTVRFTNGRSLGLSTDGAGFIAALRNGGRPGDAADEAGAVVPRRSLIVGTGGAARAVAAALLSQGVGVVVSGRNAEAGSRMTRELGVRFVALKPEVLANEVASVDLLVNATSLGGPADVAACPIPESVTLPPGLLVFDLVYRPRRTALLARAEASGCRTVEGVEMLIQQAALSLEIWTGRPVPLDVMRGAAYRALEEL